MVGWSAGKRYVPSGTNDVGLHGVIASVGQIDDRIRQRSIGAVDDFAGEQARLVFLFGLASKKLWSGYHGRRQRADKQNNDHTNGNHRSFS